MVAKGCINRQRFRGGVHARARKVKDLIKKINSHLNLNDFNTICSNFFLRINLNMKVVGENGRDPYNAQVQIIQNREREMIMQM